MATGARPSGSRISTVTLAVPVFPASSTIVYWNVTGDGPESEAVYLIVWLTFSAVPLVGGSVVTFRISSDALFSSSSFASTSMVLLSPRRTVVRSSRATGIG